MAKNNMLVCYNGLTMITGDNASTVFEELLQNYSASMVNPATSIDTTEAYDSIVEAIETNTDNLTCVVTVSNVTIADADDADSFKCKLKEFIEDYNENYSTRHIYILIATDNQFMQSEERVIDVSGLSTGFDFIRNIV